MRCTRHDIHAIRADQASFHLRCSGFDATYNQRLEYAFVLRTKEVSSGMGSAGDNGIIVPA